MTSWQFNGLPLHPLIVHAVVVLLPLAALMLILGSVWPAARRRFGILTPIVALAALIGVPLATQAGEALERQVESSAALERHAELGDHLLPWAVGLFLIAAVQWFWQRRRTRSGSARSTSPVASIVIAVVGVVVAVGATINVVQIGDTGAQAVWSDFGSSSSSPSGGDDD